ncbi:MAG: hypothetical protein F6J93_06865 [Oscillatoria sp. SIO1A7]|nr:hypothetical protein [Oscillatoria sp. SIO1A7]
MKMQQIRRSGDRGVVGVACPLGHSLVRWATTKRSPERRIKNVGWVEERNPT